MIIYVLLGLFKYLVIMVSAVVMTMSFIRGVEHDDSFAACAYLAVCTASVASFLWALDL